MTEIYDNAWDDPDSNESLLRQGHKADLDGLDLPTNGDGVRHVRLTQLSTIKPRPVRWTWEDRVPVGEVTLTPGRGGIGKSTFHAWVIARLTRGTLPGVHHDDQKACIIAAAEDSYERTIVPRLIAAGADMNLVYRADVVTVEGVEMSLSLPADCNGLENEVKRVDAALVSLDPLMSVIHGSLDTHKDREVRTAIEPLSRLADRTGAAVLANAHFNKSTGNDPLALIMGSAAFGNVVRAALGFARDTEADDESCVISQVKNNLGRLDLPSLRYAIEESSIDTEEGPARVGRLVMQGTSDRSVADILRDRDSNEDKPALDEAIEWLTAMLSDGPMLKREIATSATAEGITKATLKRAAKKIRVVSERDDSQQGRPATWTLPGYGSSGSGDDGLSHNPHGSDQGKRSQGSGYGSSSRGEPKPETCAVCHGSEHDTTTHRYEPREQLTNNGEDGALSNPAPLAAFVPHSGPTPSEINPGTLGPLNPEEMF